MSREPWLTKNRLETLADGIFAIAMTLLILNVKIPVMTDYKATTALPAALAQLRPHFIAFVLSFILLSVFWMAHHRQFHSIDKVDSVFLWLNILMLLLIVLVPFSTSLMGEYETSWVANFFFELNLFFIGLAMLSYWWYAGKDNRLTAANVTRDQYIYGLKRSLVLPGVSLVALGLSFLTPEHSTLVFLAIPVILAIFFKK